MNVEEWIEAILAGKGRISAAVLFEKEIPLPDMRALAGRHGLKPKGFRVERANAKQLGALLSEHFATNAALRQELAAHLAAAPESSPHPPAVAAAPPAETSIPRLEGEIADLRERLSREQGSAAKARRSREDAIKRHEEAERAREELLHSLREESRQNAALVAELEGVREQLSQGRREAAPDAAELAERCGELERRDVAARRRLAELTSRIRELEQDNAELEELLPRGQRERRRQRARSLQAAPGTTLLPRFSDDFFRGLAGLEVEQQRKVWAAVARLVLEGFDYPGLHAKALKGMGGLSSIRAGEHLRVYFVRDGDAVTFEGAATREEQPTYLKKRRDA